MSFTKIMAGIKHPRLPEEKDLRRKLTSSDIEEIRDRRGSGESMKSLSKDYHVSVQTIWKWCLSEDKRDELNWAKYAWYRRRGIYKSFKEIKDELI